MSIEATPLLLSQYRNLEANDYSGPPSQNILLTAIYERCIKHESLTDSKRCLRLSTKAVCLLASASAKIPYVPIALKMPVGPAFAFGNTSSFFILEWWATRGAIEDVLGPKGQAELLLIERAGRGKCYQTAVATSSATISLFSQIPVALPSLDYDGQFKIPGFTVLLISGSLIPLRSLQLTIDKTLRVQKCVLGEVGKKIETIRDEATSLVQEYRECFRQASFEEKLRILSKLDSIRLQDDTNSYLLEVLNPSSRTSPYSRCRHLCKQASFIAGAFLTATFETALVMYTWAKTKEHIENNDALAATFATITGLSWLYLTGKSITGTAQRATDFFLNFITGHKDPSIAEQIHPKLVFALKSIGIMTNLLALGPTIVIWGDFYKDNPTEQKFFVTTLCMSIFLLLSTATLEIINDYVEEHIQAKGTIDHQNIVKLDRELRKLQSLIQQSSLFDFATFLLELPAGLKTKLLEKVALAIEELTGYLDDVKVK